jgi:hypothetical protein
MITFDTQHALAEQCHGQGRPLSRITSTVVTTTEWVPLAYAMTKGPEMLNALLEAGADANAKFERADEMREWWTPLGYAIQLHSAPMVRVAILAPLKQPA